MASQPYCYDKLNEAAHEIRLLSIHPGAFESELRLSLDTVSFPKDSDLQFEALSYAWGSHENPVEIVLQKAHATRRLNARDIRRLTDKIFGVRKPTRTGSIAVTRNLVDALPYLRLRDEVRTIWIDAICVNQKDLVERSSQVKRMADIYSSARKVVVWLGIETNDTDLVIACCAALSANISVDWGPEEMSPLSSETHWADMEEPLPFNRRQWAAIGKLFDRDWFKRLWIWQEVGLARDVIVFCGDLSLPWAWIRIMVFSIYQKPWPMSNHNIPEPINASHLLLLFGLCRGVRKARIQELLEDTKYSLCSDARDRVFALLSLVRHEEQTIRIEPDYTKPPMVIYRNFVRSYIEKQEDLCLLPAIEVHGERFQSPSWVPDWSVPRLTTPLYKFKASGSSAASFRFQEHGALRLLALSIGTIEIAEPFELSRNITFGDLVRELDRITRACDIQDMVRDDGTLPKVARVLCANGIAELYSPPNLLLPTAYEAEFSLRAMLCLVDGTCERPTRGETDKFVQQMLSMCISRSLFKCADGTVAIGPRGARPGDKVVVWLGCDTAMVIRPKLEDMYQVLGEAICEDSIDGSAFLGPLPEGIELIQKYTEVLGAYLWMFIDTKTGATTSEDPRLRDIELPTGWGKKIEPDDPEMIFVNEDTGRRTRRDPRWSADSLAGRGVALDKFELI